MPSVITSESEMLLALRSHFHSPEYVLLPQVRNGAGFSANRTADAMAMSVWPSRGLYLYGIEIKVSRGDWVRELKNPKKADDIGKFCDFWMIAAGNDEIVRAGELPSGWGLLTPGKKPNTLKAAQAPTKIEAQPLHRSFLASILRVVAEETMPFKQVDAEIERRVNEKVEALRESITAELTKDLDRPRLMERNRELEATIKAFEDASGLRIHNSHATAKKYGEALKLMQWSGLDRWIEQAEERTKEFALKLAELRKAVPK